VPERVLFNRTSVLKVYPPNSKTARHAFFDLPVCTVGGRQISVIQQGTNI